jgi:chromosome segregation ATPase
VQISVADKRGNASVDDKSRAEELEARIASLHEGLQLQRRDYEDKMKELRQQIQNEQLNVRVAEQKIKDMQEQVNLANERAFDAESRLGRMQKAHSSLVADRNRSQYSTKAAATAKAAANDEALARDLEEIDMLGSELLNVDVRSFLRSNPRMLRSCRSRKKKSPT